jgi:hypothetical protein
MPPAAVPGFSLEVRYTIEVIEVNPLRPPCNTASLIVLLKHTYTL